MLGLHGISLWLSRRDIGRIEVPSLQQLSATQLNQKRWLGAGGLFARDVGIMEGPVYVFLLVRFDVWMDCATVLGMLPENWWAEYFRLCSAQPHCDQSWPVGSGYAADKLPTTLWFWNLYIALAQIGNLALLATCTTVNLRLAYRCGVKKKYWTTGFRVFDMSAKKLIKKRWLDDGRILALHVAVFVDYVEQIWSVNALHTDRNSTWHVAGNWWAACFRLCLADLNATESWPFCLLAADKLPTTLWSRDQTLAHIGCLGSLAICTKVHHRLAYRCGNPLWHGRSRKWIQDKIGFRVFNMCANQSKSVGRMMVG